MNTRNFIRYQYVDVSSETSRNAFAFRDELSSVCTYNLLPELERLLDEVDIGESTLLFDKIEIDAGEIPQENWESVFVTKVIERLRQEIMERIASKRWDSQTEPSYLLELTGVEKRRRTILDFMHSGVLDWSADIKSDSDFEQALDRWIETDVEGVDELIRCTSDTKGFLDRLTSQCNDKVLDKILVGVTGMSAESIQAARKALSALLLNSTTKVYPIRFLINQILFTSLKGKKLQTWKNLRSLLPTHR